MLFFCRTLTHSKDSSNPSALRELRGHCPQAYHTGFNTGYNIACTVSYSKSSWFLCGKSAASFFPVVNSLDRLPCHSHSYHGQDRPLRWTPWPHCIWRQIFVQYNAKMKIPWAKRSQRSMNGTDGKYRKLMHNLNVNNKSTNLQWRCSGFWEPDINKPCLDRELCSICGWQAFLYVTICTTCQ